MSFGALLGPLPWHSEVSPCSLQYLIYHRSFISASASPWGSGTLRCGPCIKLESTGLTSSDLPGNPPEPWFRLPRARLTGSSGPTWAKIFAFLQGECPIFPNWVFLTLPQMSLVPSHPPQQLRCDLELSRQTPTPRTPCPVSCL